MVEGERRQGHDRRRDDRRRADDGERPGHVDDLEAALDGARARHRVDPGRAGRCCRGRAGRGRGGRAARVGRRKGGDGRADVDGVVRSRDSQSGGNRYPAAAASAASSTTGRVHGDALLDLRRRRVTASSGLVGVNDARAGGIEGHRGSGVGAGARGAVRRVDREDDQVARQPACGNWVVGRTNGHRARV